MRIVTVFYIFVAVLSCGKNPLVTDVLLVVSEDQVMMEKHGIIPSPTWSIFRPICSTVLPPASPCLPTRPLYTLYGSLLGLRPGPPGALSPALPFPPVALHPLSVAAQSFSLAHHQQQARELQHAVSSPSSSSPSTLTAPPSPPATVASRTGEGRGGEHGPLTMYRYHPYLPLPDKPFKSPDPVAVDYSRPWPPDPSLSETGLE